MNFIEFKNIFSKFGIFSIKEIQKMVPTFYFRNLNQWKEKKYLHKIKNGWYCFPEFLNQGKSNWLIANLIYQPSYISLESALSLYGIMPEAIFTITSVSTLRTMNYKTDAGDLYYYTVKPQIYFGYKFIQFSKEEKFNFKNRQLKIAEIEKAILDFFYLRKTYNTRQDIIDLRFDRNIISKELNIDRLLDYLSMFNNIALEKRIKNMLEIYS